MSLFKLTAGTAAALLMITPTLASAETRASQSVPAAVKKGATPLKGKAGYVRVKPKDSTANGQEQGGAGGLVIGALAITAVIAAVVVVSTDS
jgi:hypothetical protein